LVLIILLIYAHFCSFLIAFARLDSFLLISCSFLLIPNLTFSHIHHIYPNKQCYEIMSKDCCLSFNRVVLASSPRFYRSSYTASAAVFESFRPTTAEYYQVTTITVKEDGNSKEKKIKTISKTTVKSVSFNILAPVGPKRRMNTTAIFCNCLPVQALLMDSPQQIPPIAEPKISGPNSANKTRTFMATANSRGAPADLAKEGLMHADADANADPKETIKAEPEAAGKNNEVIAEAEAEAEAKVEPEAEREAPQTPEAPSADADPNAMRLETAGGLDSDHKSSSASSGAARGSSSRPAIRKALRTKGGCVQGYCDCIAAQINCTQYCTNGGTGAAAVRYEYNAILARYLNPNHQIYTALAWRIKERAAAATIAAAAAAAAATAAAVTAAAVANAEGAGRSASSGTPDAATTAAAADADAAAIFSASAAAAAIAAAEDEGADEDDDEQKALKIAQAAQYGKEDIDQDERALNSTDGNEEDDDNNSDGGASIRSDVSYSSEKDPVGRSRIWQADPKDDNDLNEELDFEGDDAI
jgi:hypothetical protein